MKYILAFTTLIFGFSAHAGVLAEPFVGYSMGTSSVTVVSGTSASSKTSGAEYGARIGYRFPMGLVLAGEYAGGSGTIKYDSGSADDTYSETAMGLVVGYEHGMYRVWAGYGISDQFTDKQTGGDYVYKGTNLKIGVGIEPIHHLSVNFEYIMPKYTKYTAGGVDTDVSTTYSKFDTSAMVLSISAPFEFGGKM